MPLGQCLHHFRFLSLFVPQRSFFQPQPNRPPRQSLQSRIHGDEEEGKVSFDFSDLRFNQTPFEESICSDMISAMHLLKKPYRIKSR